MSSFIVKHKFALVWTGIVAADLIVLAAAVWLVAQIVIWLLP